MMRYADSGLRKAGQKLPGQLFIADRFMTEGNDRHGLSRRGAMEIVGRDSGSGPVLVETGRGRKGKHMGVLS